MYVTSIGSKVYKNNFRMDSSLVAEFKQFIKDYSYQNNDYFYYEQFNSGYVLYFTKDAASGKSIIQKFFEMKGTHTEESYYKIFGKDFEIFKYVANFHSKNAASEFVDYLFNDVSNELFTGFAGKVRNSVIFYCSCPETGYKIGKNYENLYMQKYFNNLSDLLTEKIEKKEVHPLDDDQKVYDPSVEVIESSDNSFANKIYKIFKGQPDKSDND